MQLFFAEEMGMCFGVKDALKVLETIDRPQEVTIHGQLVHNEIVLTQLGARGFPMRSETERERLPDTRRVLITAHGISERERQRLQTGGKELIDTTCPLVRKVHQTALDLQHEGYHILLIGKPGHVEVRGVVEDLTHFDIVPTPDAVRRYSCARLGVVCQTTIAPRMVEAVRQAITQHNPDAEIRFVDTTCHPTRNRQRALERLLPLVDTMIVIGGSHSNNTLELVELCQERGVKTYHVQDADDLRREWFRSARRVGVTAGTSTLDSTIEGVKECLQQWAAGAFEETATVSAQSTEKSAECCNSEKWCAHFRHNCTILLQIPWERGAELTPTEAAILIPSLQDIQLCESSEGVHSRQTAVRYGEKIGDSHYGEAVRLFFAEENRHSAYIARFLALANTPTIQHSWTDFWFRRFRRLMGLEMLLVVLLTAEVIGKAYYRAIYAASQSAVLRRISAQLQRDEKMHILFHIERLEMIRRQRSQLEMHV